MLHVTAQNVSATVKQVLIVGLCMQISYVCSQEDSTEPWNEGSFAEGLGLSIKLFPVQRLSACISMKRV
jgi:hypothetical protein